MRCCLNIAVVSLFIILLCDGCNASKRSAAETNSRGQGLKTADLKLEENRGVNKIVFLSFFISVKDSVKDEYDLRMTDVRYADGTMKKANAAMNSTEPQYLYCELLNGEKETLDIVRVENPLFRVFEYSNEGSNQLQKKAFTAKVGEFVIRFNLNKQTKYLSVYKISANKLKKIYYAQL